MKNNDMQIGSPVGKRRSGGTFNFRKNVREPIAPYA